MGYIKYIPTIVGNMIKAQALEFEITFSVGQKYTT